MDDVLSMNFINNSDFCLQRPDLLQEIMALKSLRRVALGPDMTVLFEHPRLVWWHIQEMLRIEQGGEKQLQEEWSVYSPMLPSAEFLTVTLMIEINDPVLRKKALSACIGIENNLFLEGAGFRSVSEPVPIGEEIHQGGEGGINHTPREHLENNGQKNNVQSDSDDREDLEAGAGNVLASPLNKTSSVHFLRFPMDQGARSAFAMGEPVLSCKHPAALYRSPMATPLWRALCHDMGIVPLKY